MEISNLYREIEKGIYFTQERDFEPGQQKLATKEFADFTTLIEELCALVFAESRENRVKTTCFSTSLCRTIKS